jgi:predicted transposase/invertase (TIGR01784 family)
MKESVTYQEILSEGLAEGKARGLAEGKAEGKAEAVRQVAANMLRSQFDINLIAQFTGLSVDEIQKL